MHISSFYFKTFDQFRFKTEHACKVKLTRKTNEDGTYAYKTNGATYTHIIDVRDKEVKKLIDAAKKAANETDQTTRDIYASVLAGKPEEVIARMPTASTVGKNIRNQRKGDHPKAPKTLSELGLPPIHTNSGEDFIMYDSGLDPTNRIIMFSNEKSLDFLVKCEVLHMDGTVQSGPMLFDQIYVIHGKYYFHLFTLFQKKVQTILYSIG